MRALVTGATGFIGRRLVAALRARGDAVVVVSRDAEAARRSLGAEVEAHAWTPEAGLPAAALEGVDLVFHLAGEPVAEGRWTAAKKEKIRESRVKGTRSVVEAIGARPAGKRPGVLVSASAVGIYGDRGDEVLDETSPPGTDFLAEVCRAWEEEAGRATAHGARVACARIGIVLGEAGGALAKMLLPFKLGLGGRIASGRQWMPWVHVDDIIGLLLHAAGKREVEGPMNAVAPGVVTNREFTKALASALWRPAIFPIPAIGLRLAFGEFAGVLVASQRAVPKVAENTGYVFRYRDLAAALRDILAPVAGAAAGARSS